jgi:hypothetical protein
METRRRRPVVEAVYEDRAGLFADQRWIHSAGLRSLAK